MFYPPLIAYLVLLLVSAGLAISSSRDGLPPNMVIGIRTRHTLSSVEAWHAGQRAGVPYLVAMAVVSAAYALSLLTVELVGNVEAIGHVLAVSGFLIIVAIALLAWRAADVAAKSTRSAE